MKAMLKGAVIAQSDKTVEIEGNHYFPPESVKLEVLKPDASFTTICPWKGTASYYDIIINGEVLKRAAWYYPAPRDKARHIKDYIAFWKDVQVS